MLSYNSRSGVFTWKQKISDKVVIGKVAGTIMASGYIQIRLGSVFYRAHRLAWQYVHGTAPKGEIDHIDGSPGNNKLRNLRDVSASVNQQNRVATGGNFLPGVHRNGKRFAARIGIGGKTYCLGTYDTQEQAHEVYMRYKTKISPRMSKEQQQKAKEL